MTQPDPYPVGLQQWIDTEWRLGAHWDLCSDEDFAHMTPAAMTAALAGFRIDLAHGRTIEWLATSVRRALTIVSARPEGMPRTIQGSSATRSNLKSLANRAARLADGLSAITMPEDEAVRQICGQVGLTILQTASAQLILSAAILNRTASSLQSDSGKWRASAERELRVRRAHYLSPIFESAFSTSATVNDRPGAADMGPWPDFFERTVRLATGRGVPGLRETVKEARRRHLEGAIAYPPEIVDL